MMDGALLPIDKVYEAITTPAKRRKIIVVKRQTADPKAIQNARNLGKELFAEMGPDGEDGLFTFLQRKLKDWQTCLNGYKPLADTGNYPGKEEITDGLTLINKLLADKESQQVHRALQHAEERPARLRRAVSRPGTLLRPPEADLGEAPQGARRSSN